MSVSNPDSYAAALVRELDGVRAAGNKAREEAVLAELRRLGHGAAAPAQRAEQRPAAAKKAATRSRKAR